MKVVLNNKDFSLSPKVLDATRKEILWKEKVWGNTELIEEEEWQLIIETERDKSGHGLPYIRYLISVKAGTGRKGIVTIRGGDDFRGDRSNPATRNPFDLKKELKKIGVKEGLIPNIYFDLVTRVN